MAQTLEKPVIEVKEVRAVPVPAFSDISKAANDLINKDFYHLAKATLDVKVKTPNGTNINVKGKQDPNNVTSGSVEAKYTDKLRGLTLTQNFTTGSLLDTKAELTDYLVPGAKLELQNIASASGASPMAQKLNLAWKNPNVHTRAFISHSMKDGNINAVIDAVAGQDGFVVGGEAGYNLQKAAITGYSLAIGYQAPTYTAAITGTQNLSIIAASLYQKVSPVVEVGIKTGYDVQNAKASGLEVASKYKLDPLSFAKAKVNDRGIAALAYSTKLNAGTTLGLGLSLDTANMNEGGHKLGGSLTFEN